jgi:hypothetical protein
MIQYNQVGKYKSKQSVLDAKKNRTFITPKGRTYMFDYFKDGRKYIFTLIYKGIRMNIKESDYNLTDIDDLIDAIIKEIN